MSPEESAFYFSLFDDKLQWESSQIRIFGKSYDTPRLEAFYAESGQGYSYSGKKLSVNPFTKDLSQLRDRVLAKIADDFPGAEFNSVLANLYRDGRDSNGWHADDEKELGRNPLIASLSLGAERRFDLQHKFTGQKITFSLQPGSLLIMGGEIQHYWKHRLPKDGKVKSARINLTFRKIG